MKGIFHRIGLAADIKGTTRSMPPDRQRSLKAHAARPRPAHLKSSRPKVVADTRHGPLGDQHGLMSSGLPSDTVQYYARAADAPSMGKVVVSMRCCSQWARLLMKHLTRGVHEPCQRLDHLEGDFHARKSPSGESRA